MLLSCPRLFPIINNASLYIQIFFVIHNSSFWIQIHSLSFTILLSWSRLLIPDPFFVIGKSVSVLHWKSINLTFPSFLDPSFLPIDRFNGLGIWIVLWECKTRVKIR
jgi:hypothetical protein